VVAVGETVTAVPLVTAPTLWSTLPVPLEKTAVRVVEAPAVMVLLAAAKLVMEGAAATVTVTSAVAVPVELVTVSV
jgi:hypothetical protein